MSVTLVNARLLLVDEAMTEVRRGWLRVEGTRIAALGEGDPPPEEPSTGEVMDVGGDLVMPGMVNPHGHLPMTLFRGLAEDVDDRLLRYILPLERACVTEGAVRAGTRLALLESIRGGVTTVADMYYFEDAVAEEVEAAGLRAVLGQTVANFGAPDHADAEGGLRLASQLAERWGGHPLVTPGVAPHAPYSTGLPTMRAVAAWADAHPGLPVQMHLAETRDELAWAEREHGMSTVAVTDRAGLLRPGLVAAHCMYLSEADMDLLATRGVGVAHNARSNGKAGRGIAPVTALRVRGVPVGLASDGAMSGNTLDLFGQMAPAAMFQKIAGGSRRPLPARDVVRMATIEGARVLGLSDRIGSLEAGKEADLIRVSLSDPRQQPVHDLCSALVFATLPSDVVDVMVAGRWLLRGREALTVEPARAVAGALAVAGTFAARIAAIDRGLA